MTKHTPGPWIVWPDNNNRLQVGQSTNYTVAQMMQTPIHGQEANARLIAAAPDLLEALQKIKQRLDTCHLHVLSGHEVFDSFYMEVIDSNIAKATGEKNGN